MHRAQSTQEPQAQRATVQIQGGLLRGAPGGRRKVQSHVPGMKGAETRRFHARKSRGQRDCDLTSRAAGLV